MNKKENPTDAFQPSDPAAWQTFRGASEEVLSFWKDKAQADAVFKETVEKVAALSSKRKFSDTGEWQTWFLNLLEAQNLIALIRSNLNPNRLEAMRQLSGRYRNEVQDFFSTKMDQASAADLAAQALASLIENIMDGKFQGNSGVRTYLWAIARNLYKKHLSNNKYQIEQEGFPLEAEPPDDPEALFLQKEKTEKVAAVLAMLGEKCQQILVMWSMKYSMRDIAEKRGFKNETVARVSKQRCFENLLKLIEKNAHLKKILKELR